MRAARDPFDLSRIWDASDEDREAMRLLELEHYRAESELLVKQAMDSECRTVEQRLHSSKKASTALYRMERCRNMNAWLYWKGVPRRSRPVPRSDDDE